jgi:hypothetical protein
MPQFTDNQRLYFNKVFDLCKKGMTRKAAFEEVENEYFEAVGKAKYDSFEAFKMAWYRYWKQRSNRK